MRVYSEFVLCAAILIAIVGACLAYYFAHSFTAALAASAGVLLTCIVFAMHRSSID